MIHLFTQNCIPLGVGRPGTSSLSSAGYKSLEVVGKFEKLLTESVGGWYSYIKGTFVLTATHSVGSSPCGNSNGE